MKEEHFLIGDISGTNITLGIAKFSSNIHKIIFKKNYLTKDFDGLCEVTTKFLDEISKMKKVIIKNAVFGVATKIPESFDMIFHLTNSPFVIERNKLIETTSIKNATYINDFESFGYSVLDINTNKLREINEGLSSKIDYPIMTVIGAGTGLGKVKLAYDSTLKNMSMSLPNLATCH